MYIWILDGNIKKNALDARLDTHLDSFFCVIYTPIDVTARTKNGIIQK